MTVQAAYVAVIVIWATTPLGIQWSAETLGPELAGLSRTLLAIPLAMLLHICLRVRFPWHKRAVLSYAAGAMMVFGAMYSSYIASSYISSGLLSVIWGLVPIATGIAAIPILKQNDFTFVKLVALLCSITGLATIFNDKIIMQSNGWLGVAVLLVGIAIYSSSAVTVKKLEVRIHPLAQTTGSLILALPGYFVAWAVNYEPLPELSMYDRGIWAVVYLAIMGSIIGFICYFYILQKLSTATVSLISLVCPALAVMVGSLLNDEALTISYLLGSALVLSGLALYQYGAKLSYVFKLTKRRTMLAKAPSD